MKLAFYHQQAAQHMAEGGRIINFSSSTTIANKAVEQTTLFRTLRTSRQKSEK